MYVRGLDELERKGDVVRKKNIIIWWYVFIIILLFGLGKVSVMVFSVGLICKDGILWKLCIDVCKKVFCIKNFEV